MGTFRFRTDTPPRFLWIASVIILLPWAAYGKRLPPGPPPGEALPAWLRIVYVVMGLYALNKALRPAVLERVDNLGRRLILGDVREQSACFDELSTLAVTHADSALRIRACMHLTRCPTLAAAERLIERTANDESEGVRVQCLALMLERFSTAALSSQLRNTALASAVHHAVVDGLHRTLKTGTLSKEFAKKVEAVLHEFATTPTRESSQDERKR